MAGLFAADKLGELSFEIVRMISGLVKKDPYGVRPEVRVVFFSFIVPFMQLVL